MIARTHAKRPENVRCEKCCYFEAAGQAVYGEDSGYCLRRAHPQEREPLKEGERHAVYLVVDIDFYCGEFRREWPNTEDQHD